LCSGGGEGAAFREKERGLGHCCCCSIRASREGDKGRGLHLRCCATRLEGEKEFSIL